MTKLYIWHCLLNNSLFFCKKTLPPNHIQVSNGEPLNIKVCKYDKIYHMIIFMANAIAMSMATI